MKISVRKDGSVVPASEIFEFQDKEFSYNPVRRAETPPSPFSPRPRFGRRRGDVDGAAKRKQGLPPPVGTTIVDLTGSDDEVEAMLGLLDSSQQGDCTKVSPRKKVKLES